ncbi:2-pyrone-4,6-dicarbaxylate hydrolase [Cucumis melo var. makuwa]|uniref:2-pyrone-4,6-dicarbaxylate hydrolase n=2 Tax=Cucumis melo TaxID=3656 RepID=A0A5A7TN82_CUCMM|nr:uncharacterized protein LOC103494570 [Cucumis melo]KAA0044564.1 2-pyrone-4,6-dicarbaxylate hydrolase [Cucumis melo var. makuwa]
MVVAARLKLLSLPSSLPSLHFPSLPFPSSATIFASQSINTNPSFKLKMASSSSSSSSSSYGKVIDSHLHVWASPEEAAAKYPYFPGQEPTLTGHVDFLLQSMEEAGVDGALIVQPINHKFDHSYVTSVINKYPNKFVGCCLANPAKDGSGIQQLEHLVTKDGYSAVRFNPYLWPSGQKMTNEVGKALFSTAGKLGIPVGFMCMKGLSLHVEEIKELCTEFPSTTVLLDHLGFCKPPENEEDSLALSHLLELASFPQIYVKFSALFRVSRRPFPYLDLTRLLSQIVSSFGANRIMWGSDFPFVVLECGYNGAIDAVTLIANEISLSSGELEWIKGKTVAHLFQSRWISS